MVIRGYRIVKGVKVPTKKQREREKDPEYRKRLAKVEAQERRKKEFEAQKEAPKKPREPKISPVIKLEPKKKGLAALVEKETVAGKVAKILTSPKTTLVLGATLATLTFIPAAITAVATRAIAGRAVPELIKFGAGRFVTNPKTLASSTSLLMKIGIGVGAASLLVGAIGSYPFAGFLKEEALQTLNIGIYKAMEGGDYEGAQKLIDEVDEILANRGAILNKIPYANVLQSLNEFFDAAELTNQEWKELLRKAMAQREGEEETEFARQRRETDEAARQRKLETMEFDARYYALIREGKFDEAQELLAEQMKGGV